MKLLDVIIAPLFILIIIYISVWIKKNYIPSGLKQFFLPALLVKIIGSLGVGLIYQFYYSGGDTFNFFSDAQILCSAFFSKPVLGIKLIFATDPNDYLQSEYLNRIFFAIDPSSFIIVKILAIALLFSFGTYSGAALLFGIIGFFSLWKLFALLVKIYPKYSKAIAISVLFIPSVAFWGSGILKDTITMSAVCWLIVAFHNLFFDDKRKIIYLVILVFSFFILYQIKIYIALCLVPACFFWYSTTISKKISSQFIRVVITPIVLLFATYVSYIALQKIGEDNARYNLETVAETAEITARYLAYVSNKEGGSGYSLGDFDYSPTGMVAKFFPAVNVTLFRPYIWEVNNVVMLISALESLAFLLLTIWAIKRRGIINSIRLIGKSPFLGFCLLFSIAFAFAVGISTYNFGSLVRYKIPILPFYGIFLVLLGDFKEKRSRKRVRMASVEKRLVTVS